MKKIMIVAALAAVSTFSYANEEIDKIASGKGPAEIITASTNIVDFALSDNVGLKTFKGNKAVEVGNFAFRGCLNLKSVELDAVTDMSRSQCVFAGCPSLTNVTLRSMQFTGKSPDSAFPWHAYNRNIRFHFKDGTFNRLGKRIK